MVTCFFPFRNMADYLQFTNNLFSMNYEKPHNVMLIKEWVNFIYTFLWRLQLAITSVFTHQMPSVKPLRFRGYSHPLGRASALDHVFVYKIEKLKVVKLHINRVKNNLKCHLNSKLTQLYVKYMIDRIWTVIYTVGICNLIRNHFVFS